jgi:hypothetical protein
VVCHAFHAPKQFLGLIEPPLCNQIVYKPEVTKQERALAPAEAVLCPVAVDEPARGKLIYRRLDGGLYPEVVVRKETEYRNQKARRIERLCLVVLNKTLFPFIPPFL